MPYNYCSLLLFIGWLKVKYDHGLITIAKGMELEFSGIGKE
jgi:hypothetical protein